MISRDGGEPFKQLVTQGMVHGRTFKDPDTERFLRPKEVTLDSNGDPMMVGGSGKAPLVSFEKMSKSKYNGVDPVEVVKTYGADVTRLHILYKAPPREVLEWETDSIVGMQRWLVRLGRLVDTVLEESLPRLSIESAKKTYDEWSEETRELYREINLSIRK
ncbi:Leucyl-tRNA synthetase, mitochondrial, partial [Spiromyces aspiralis]